MKRTLISSVSTYHVSSRSWTGLSVFSPLLFLPFLSLQLWFSPLFSQPPNCHSRILSRAFCFAPPLTDYFYAALPAEAVEGTWPTWCLDVDSSCGCKRGPARLKGEDFQSPADVSYTGVHHTGFMCCYELFTLFFCGRECKWWDVRAGLNKIWVEQQEAVADSWGLECHLRIPVQSLNLLQQLQ